MRDHLKEFLAYLKLNRHVSPHTVRAYDSDVTQYLAFVASETGKKMSALGAAGSRHAVRALAHRRAE